jgi:predicted Zn-dependent protease
MLTSGKIIYGSPFNAYLDKILDKLLVNEPELRSKIRIYIIKSPEVNAAATSTGIIFYAL